MRRAKVPLVIGVCWVASLPLVAVETSFWQVGSFEDFVQGTLDAVSVSKDGELRLAPETRALFTPDENMALSLAGDGHKNLYVGTGHAGKVFRVDETGKGLLFFTAPEADIFALAAGPDGSLYVGSSPDGKIYRVTPDGKSKVFYDPKTKYIWALRFDGEGRLYAGTGDHGKILRIDKNGQGEVFFDTKQTHVMCLTFDRQGNLLAGSVPNGLIYRITPAAKAFVLYQAGLPEVHALATDEHGNIYAAALGGSGGKGTPEIFGPATPTPAPTVAATVTVEAGSDGDGTTAQTKAPQAPPNEPAKTPSFNRPSNPAVSFPVPKVPQGRGSLIEILPDYTAETIWSSNNESIFGLAVRDNHVLFSTDSNGRIFDLSASREGRVLTLLTETRESLATQLCLEGQDVYVATTNIAKLFRLRTALSREGTYESAVKDTKFISHWGTLAWRGEKPEGSRLEFFTRSGNTDRPDQTWSDWKGPYRNPNGNPISSPTARYIQWKAVFRASGAASPALDEVTVSYLNQNLPPEIRSLNVSASGERTSTTGTPSAGASPSAPPPPFSPAPAPGATPAKVPITFSWQADDPNGDQLVYSLYVKAADEQEWRLLKDKLRQTNYTLEPDTLADGKYAVRLLASDEDANPPDSARRAELVSAPFWVDNTPPAVRVLKQQVSAASSGGQAEVQFEAEDSTSPLRSAEFSTDGKEWRDVNSDDGIVDSQRETFTVRAGNLPLGEHVIALRAYDTAGNAGIGKAVVQVRAGDGTTGH
jgi:sugar lactone lactonase YvrE